MRVLRKSWTQNCWLALVALTLGAVPARGQDPRSFIPLIKDAASGDLLSLASDVLQFAESLFGPSANDSIEIILNRINNLEGVVRKGFQDLGLQLDMEIQDLRQDLLNELHMEWNKDAIAHAITAERDLYLYKLTGDSDYLVFAANESSLATAKLEQETNPFYISGLICAGNARIDYFRALEPNWVQDPVLVNEVIQLIQCLEGMINSVRQSVESEHTVVFRDEVIEVPNPHGVRVVHVYSYVHLHRGIDINSFGGRGPKAQAAAEQDRLKGIQEELAFMSIPNFELTLKTWKDLIGPGQ
jgi:hypothetical protein